MSLERALFTDRYKKMTILIQCIHKFENDTISFVRIYIISRQIMNHSYDANEWAEQTWTKKGSIGNGRKKTKRKVARE